MRKILIVEDEAAYMKILQEGLIAKGYEVLSAKDGVSGLSEALKSHPDLILLDIRMPKMNGIDMLEELRKDPYGASVKVIMLTNLEPDDDLIKKTINNYPSYYLIKSDIRMDELYGIIEDLFNNDRH